MEKTMRYVLNLSLQTGRCLHYSKSHNPRPDSSSVWLGLTGIRFGEVSTNKVHDCIKLGFIWVVHKVNTRNTIQCFGKGWDRELSNLLFDGHGGCTLIRFLF